MYISTVYSVQKCFRITVLCKSVDTVVPAEGKMSDSDTEPRLEFNASVRHRYGDIISDSVVYYTVIIAKY
jgi:hypothetical protein